MQRIVINRCYGGFGLSIAAILAIAARKDQPVYFYITDYDSGNGEYGSRTCKRIETDEQAERALCFYTVGQDLGDVCSEVAINAATHLNFDSSIDRADPALVAVVEELGEQSWGKFAELKIVEIPDGVNWEVSDYDGMESVEERHRSWG